MRRLTRLKDELRIRLYPLPTFKCCRCRCCDNAIHFPHYTIICSCLYQTLNKLTDQPTDHHKRWFVPPHNWIIESLSGVCKAISIIRHFLRHLRFLLCQPHTHTHTQLPSSRFSFSSVTFDIGSSTALSIDMNFLCKRLSDILCVGCLTDKRKEIMENLASTISHLKTLLIKNWPFIEENFF